MEGAVLDLIKYLWMPVLGLLGWLGKKTFATMEQRIQDSEDKVDALDKNLTRNYFDKDEIREHIVAPLEESQRETRSELKALAGTVNEIHQDMGILKYALLDKENNK